MSVYFIACGGFIKVGFSKDPEKRAKNLFKSTTRYTAPRASFLARGSQTLLGYIEGDKTTEYWLHQALSDFDAGCEWFIDEPILRAYLTALASEWAGGDDFPALVRKGGPIWKTLPHGERGGGNHQLAYELMAKRAAS